MKPILKLQLLLTIPLALLFTNSFAQPELWGLTSRGGSSGIGTIFKTDINGDNFTTVHTFSTMYPGNYPRGGLYEVSIGKLYGMTGGGGIYGHGVLFEYDPQTYAYTIRFHFDFDNGASLALKVV